MEYLLLPPLAPATLLPVTTPALLMPPWCGRRRAKTQHRIMQMNRRGAAATSGSPE